MLFQSVKKVGRRCIWTAVMPSNNLKFEFTNHWRKKMKHRSTLPVFGLLLALSLVLAACAPAAPTAAPATEAPAAEEPAAEEPVTISYWHTMSDAETAQLDEVIAAFEAANPGITVEPTRYAYDDFKPALLTGLAGGEAPDTARMDIAWVSEFANQSALLQLDGAMPDFDAISAGNFPRPPSTNTWEGHHHGFAQKKK